VADERESGVRLVVSLYREFEQAARRGDMSMAQYRTLLYLLGGARRAGELAAANAVTRPTVSTMISSLREKGWVSDDVDPTDGRVSKIVLTRAGRARVRRFESELADRLEALLPGVDRDELRSTMRSLYASHATTRDERLGNVFEPRGRDRL
jgi:DNA-binding MarR family transcriptional regulator